MFFYFACAFLGVHLFIILYILSLRYNEIVHTCKHQSTYVYPMALLFLVFFVNCHVYKILPDRDIFGIDEWYLYYIRLILQDILIVVIIVEFKFIVDPLPIQPKNSLKGQTVLITGGSSGIGLGAAKQLAELGAKVIITTRTKESGINAVNEVKEYLNKSKRNGEGTIDFMILNFSSFESVKLFYKEFTGKYSQLDILVNNAGFFPHQLAISPPPFESRFGEMHLGHFYLTGLLLRLLLNNQQRKPKIITTSSVAHYWAKESYLNEFYGKEVKEGWPSYSRAKLLNVLFMRELSKRFNDKLYCYSFHPGAVRTNITRFLKENPIKIYFRFVLNLFSFVLMRNTLEGSIDIVYLSVQNDANFLKKNNGKYFLTNSPVDDVNPIINDKLSQKMWDFSIESIAHFDPSFPQLFNDQN